MEEYVTLAQAWVAASGVPPVVVGVVLATMAFALFTARRSVALASTGQPIAEPVVTHARIDRTVDYEDRAIAIPGEVLDHVDAGDRIAAIKAMRAGANVELVDAKRIVDALMGRRGA